MVNKAIAESAVKQYLWFHREQFEAVCKPKNGTVSGTFQFLVDYFRVIECNVNYSTSGKVFNCISNVRFKDVESGCPYFDATGLVHNMDTYNYLIEDMWELDKGYTAMCIFNRHEGGYRSVYILTPEYYQLRFDEISNFELKGITQGTVNFEPSFENNFPFIAFHNNQLLDGYDFDSYREYFVHDPNIKGCSDEKKVTLEKCYQLADTMYMNLLRLLESRKEH